MASNFLKEKLTEAAKLSPAFQELPLEQQAEMISSLENASDAQVLEAIKAFDEDKQKAEQAVANKVKKEAKLAENAKALEEEIKQSRSDMDRMDMAKEEASHQAEVSKLEGEISKLNAVPQVKPRKKFLGIF